MNCGVPPHAVHSAALAGVTVVVVVVPWLQVYVGLPPETVSCPFVSWQTIRLAHAATLIVIVSEPQGKVYVIFCVPTPAVVGLKIPLALTPKPDHVPPAVAAVSAIGASVTHTSCGIQIVASQQVVGIGAHADAANSWTPPLREAFVEFPVPPHAIISPPEFTLTS